jgi:hypothetical protein
MESSVYLGWLVTSSISLFFVLLALLRILSNPAFRGKLFHQLMVLLLLGDFFIATSWFLGNKTKNSYHICLIQEYLLQFGLLSRALMTVMLCYLSYGILTLLTLPSFTDILLRLVVCVSSVFLILSISIYFNTGDIFCSNSIDRKVDEIKYGVIILCPIYCCLLIDVGIYLVTRSKVYQLNQSMTSQTQNNISNLLNISKQLLRYPVLYALLLFPDVLYGVYVYVTGHPNLYFSVIASSSMGITGGVFSLRYLFRHDPTLLSIAPLLFTHQAQSLLNFGATFSSINFSFRRRDTPPQDSGSLNPHQPGNSGYLRRHRIDSSSASVVTHGTDASPVPVFLMRSAPGSSSMNISSDQSIPQSDQQSASATGPPLSRLSAFVRRQTTETINPINGDLIHIDSERFQSEEREKSKGIWTTLFSYEFSHSRSVSGSSEMLPQSTTPQLERDVGSDPSAFL